MTKLERKVFNVLMNKRIPFIPNHRIGPFEADFYLPNFNLVIEVDGDKIHSKQDVKRQDAKKNEWYIRNGYNLIRLPQWAINQSPTYAVMDSLGRLGIQVVE